MTIFQRINRFFAEVEWKWSLWGFIVTAATSSGFAAWAASETQLLSQYAPLSWVLAGLAAFLTVAVVYLVWSVARTISIRAYYNRSLYEKSGFVDPMANTFENKRIFLSEFCLPSDPYIAGKTFINCEIIGPSNLFLRHGNRVDEHKFSHCDAVLLAEGSTFYNGITVDGCMFRGCSFKRISLMLTKEERDRSPTVDWLNWISTPIHADAVIPGLLADATQASANVPPLPTDTAEEKPQ